MRVMILYEHCSPHQVTAVEHSRQMFHEQGHELIPVEFYYGSTDYTWTLSDKHRPEQWRCFYPDKKKVSTYWIIQDIRDSIKKLQIDVVVINGWYGLYAWCLVLLKWKIGCKFVIVSDSVYFDSARSLMKELPKKMFLSGIDAGFVAGTPQAEYLETIGMSRRQMTFGCDVVDNAMYSSIPVRNSPKDRKIVIGTAARLIAKKNLQAAMHAFVIVIKKNPSRMLEWRIAGQGPLDVELKQLAEELQIPVVFEGFVGYYDMPAYYQKLDLYWQPSLSEPWGLVVNEAMASGLPILASERCGCATDLVTPLNGWIHGISTEEMAQSLDVALSDSDHWPERGSNSRELIKEWDLQRFAHGLFMACQIADTNKR